MTELFLLVYKANLFELSNAPIEPIGIYAAYHKNKWVSRKLETFISALREQKDWFHS
ncbi:hypothetical protein [Shouchella clausii]|uniref:hypothetical protein n=1 Tax=Shouchella clausii TaxID=79880 RepID=UPI0032EC9501